MCVPNGVQACLLEAAHCGAGPECAAPAVPEAMAVRSEADLELASEWLRSGGASPSDLAALAAKARRSRQRGQFHALRILGCVVTLRL